MVPRCLSSRRPVLLNRLSRQHTFERQNITLYMSSMKWNSQRHVASGRWHFAQIGAREHYALARAALAAGSLARHFSYAKRPTRYRMQLWRAHLERWLGAVTRKLQMNLCAVATAVLFLSVCWRQ